MTLTKLAESSHWEDFVAGVDPTGVNTFNNALENGKENEMKHQGWGNLGGFIGGGLIGTLAPAAGMFAAAKGAKAFNPGLADEFGIMAKGTMDALNPAALARYGRSLPELIKFKNQGGDILTDAKKLNNLKSKGPSALNDLDIQEGKRIVKELPKKQEALNKTEDELSKRYFKGKTVAEGGNRAFTAITTAGAGALSGGMGALSANAQYNTGQRVRDMQEKEANLPSSGLTKLAARQQKVTTSFEVTADEDQVAAFASLLKNIQALSNVGATRTIELEIDGDGAANFRFKADGREIKGESTEGQSVTSNGLTFKY